MGENGLTPMIKQYMRIKEDHKDAILMYRLGDFYEMFFEDAVEAANILNITLTSRNKNDENSIPLCGVPHHSVDGYIAKLLEAGKRVAICDQMEDPKSAKGVVKREVTRVLTPGVVTDAVILDSPKSNYLASIFNDGEKFGLSWADASTGEFKAMETDALTTILSEISRIAASELLIPKNFTLKAFNRILLTELDVKYYDHKKIVRLEGANQIIENHRAASCAASAIFSYIDEKQCGRTSQFERIELVKSVSKMQLDSSTIRNLELTNSMFDYSTKDTLIEILDRTRTAMGCRLIREWLLYPLTNVDLINKRLTAVEQFVSRQNLLSEISTYLKQISDIERISSRLALNSATPRDLWALAQSVEILPKIKTSLLGCKEWLCELSAEIVELNILSKMIFDKLSDEPPHNLSAGGVIRDGADELLDELRSMIRGGRDSIATLERKERERSGIQSLKVRFNKVFGYYIEVTNAHKDKVPVDYIRKQTLVNAERFITPELKDFEEKVLGAEEKIKAREEELFIQLRGDCAKSVAALRKNATILANIDALASLAHTAIERKYAKPEISDDSVIEIKEGRHPIVEANPKLEKFVPNDVRLDSQLNRTLLITGPNMAGKSTLMRQTALIVLMAQMGSFVPATSAKIGVVDRIFTRVGASDALSRGESTFMVEMNEAAFILSHATSKSLVIVDEIGRGTSTFDGLAIAWAVAEHLNNNIKARTLFATHYHELTDLAQSFEGIVNYNVAIREWKGKIIFLRKLMQGATSRSYGIQVASLAGLPACVIDRSKEVLKNLEAGEYDEKGKPRIGYRSPDSDPSQLNLFTAEPNPMIEKIKQMDLNELTPLDALNLLHEIKKEV